ncbi:MAG: V-type ATPase subunit [Eubacteriales bacterium]
MNNMKFSTINTKISALRSTMLTNEQVEEIISLNTVDEVFDFLVSHTPYVDVLWNLKGNKIHRGDMERGLYRYNVVAIERLMFYLSDEYKSFLKKYMIRYEIEDLKLIIESVTGRVKLENIENHLLSSPKYTDMNFHELLQQQTLQGVLDQLKETKYYRLLLPYCEQIDEKFNFYIEMILDRYYYKQLFLATKKITSEDNKKSIEIIRRNIDLLNLEWVYRATKYYDMSKEEIMNFVLDHGYKYDYYKLKELVYSYALSDLLNYLSQTEYGFLFNHKGDLDLYMERRMERYLYYKALNLYKTSILDFGKVMAYIQLVEFEIKDLISIIESKRYRLPVKEATAYLIRSMEVLD